MKSALKLVFRNIILLISLLISNLLTAQTVNPAKWSWELVPQKPQVGDYAEIVFKVKIENDWYLYSSDFDPQLGPVVTTVKIENNPSFLL